MKSNQATLFETNIRISEWLLYDTVIKPLVYHRDHVYNEDKLKGCKLYKITIEEVKDDRR